MMQCIANLGQYALSYTQKWITYLYYSTLQLLPLSFNVIEYIELGILEMHYVESFLSHSSSTQV